MPQITPVLPVVFQTCGEKKRCAQILQVFFFKKLLRLQLILNARRKASASRRGGTKPNVIIGELHTWNCLFDA